ncbi:hypothetical protein CANTEDRAFT_114891 [Yamadazyma tenuis ATCC 10573]|uniref:Uncharacterized protein n=2 Tax=Candida tenuis TaxID=2315449 RepID=G3BAI8_CANTC|nr:uncharacterized protein CANTEDRAFT_114891 [Yamadazyma tenuis ATCC 10573]EGV61412.1 hypothetical protein CANTEDRAFT_114891 [Yamadazyma tenuis ATCC 10573]
MNQAEKGLKSILNFMAENENIFQDDLTRNSFIDLCTNTALYESKAINITLKKYPDVIDTFSKYKALTLNNNSVYTPSAKKVHSNDFDYKVLCYIGCIIVWADFSHNLGILQKETLKSRFGGYHLWDQLFKESTINMKRWKHIIEFRETFPFQPNQFIVILRLLHIGI